MRQKHTHDSLLKGAVPAGNVMAMVKAQAREINSTSWRELVSSTGRKYYYNTVTKMTTYEMPSDYLMYLEMRGRAASTGTLSKEQQEEIFFNVLRERQVRSDMAWEHALRAIIDHPEYKIIPTLLERKAAFVRFQVVQGEAEREEKKLQGQANRERFKAMLGRVKDLPERWSEAQEMLKDEPEYKAIESVRERSMLYEDFMNEKFRIEEVIVIV